MFKKKLYIVAWQKCVTIVRVVCILKIDVLLYWFHSQKLIGYNITYRWNADQVRYILTLCNTFFLLCLKFSQITLIEGFQINANSVTFWLYCDDCCSLNYEPPNQHFSSIYHTNFYVFNIKIQFTRNDYRSGYKHTSKWVYFEDQTWSANVQHHFY